VVQAEIVNDEKIVFLYPGEFFDISAVSFGHFQS